ncbi:protein GVQW3-like [Mercenaria mercenaria]|uniref:protein GVQW3-like n=1 Tax=Mercenaria mercenaria TaxID=6596 RepID=UPI00234FAE7C|nr:protein GVQW3-like [Mercenaria mercenaria]
MVGKRSVNAAEIRGYIKTRCQLGVSAKEIFDELCVHGQNEVSYPTVTRWIKKFKSGCDSINDAPKSGRPCSATSNTMVNKVCDVVKSDARLTVHQIASRVGISAASVFRILKRNLKMRRITARWILHLLSDKQKHVRLETARKLLKMFPKYQRKQFSDIITGDET